MDTINLDGFTDLQECLEKALPPVEGEVRKYKDGDYKFISGKWKKLKQGEEKNFKFNYTQLNQNGKFLQIFWDI